MCQKDRQRQHVDVIMTAPAVLCLSLVDVGRGQVTINPFKGLCHPHHVWCWLLNIFISFPGYLPIALCRFSASSSFRLRSKSVSGLELLAVEVSCFDLAEARRDFSDSSIWLLELFMLGWTSTELLTVLLLRLLHWESVLSGSMSVSVSSRLWLSSELESLEAALSGVLLLLLSELLDTGAACTDGGPAAVFKGRRFSVSFTTAELGDDCATLVMETGAGAVWLAGVGVTEADALSGPGVAEFVVEGGTGAFRFFCWLSEPTPVWR